MNGGRFDFDDGGTYCGGWEDGKAHGHGVCTGPKGQGEYSGAWHYGFEVSGVYTWPSGNTYDGQWQNGKRHGLGVERRGRWIYRGEWTQGYKGRYGIRQSTNSQAKYEGTWASGLQDGYGVEMYADGGTYQGQWLRGMRHGYGVRRSAPYGVAAKYRSRSHAHASLTSLRSDQGDEGADKDVKKGDDSRGGFVLRARSEPPSRRRSLSERSKTVKNTILHGLRITKQRSTGDINQRVTTSGTGETPRSIRSSGSTGSCASDESGVTGYSGGQEHGGSFIGAEEFVDPNATESYMGEWKNDKRSGFGISERSDGLKYEGEWFNNKKYGYGVTTFKDGTKEEGKYKNNVIVTSRSKKNMLFVRSSKLRERTDAAVQSAGRASQIAVQKADIAVSRASTSHDRAEQADVASLQARDDSEVARLCAKQFAPEFSQPGIEVLKKRRLEMGNHIGAGIVPTYLTKPLHTADLLMKNPYIRSTSLVIPKSQLISSLSSVPATAHHHTPGDDKATTASTSSPDTTPPMQTPPQEIRPPLVSHAQQQQQQSLPTRTLVGVAAGGGGVIPPPPPAPSLSQQQQQRVIGVGAGGGGGGGELAVATANVVGSDDLLLNAMQLDSQQQQQQQHQLQQRHHQQQEIDFHQQQIDYHHYQLQQQHQQMSRLRMLQDQQRSIVLSLQEASASASAIPYEHQNALSASVRGAGARLPPSVDASALQYAAALSAAGGGGEHYRDDASAASYATYPPMRGVSGHHYGPAAASPQVSRTPSQTSSRYSMINDYFDQYSMASNPAAGKLLHQNLMGHRRRGRQPPPGADWDGAKAESAHLVRRSTLATARDYPYDSAAAASALAAFGGGESPQSHRPSTSGGVGGMEFGVVHRRPKLAELKQFSMHDYIDSRSSMPDLVELEKNPLQMTREEIARLSSRRRQEMQRQAEEAELLRSNPLRYFKYLYHPSVRTWLVRWKLPLLVLFVNLGLTVIFYHLLTYSNLDDENNSRSDDTD